LHFIAETDGNDVTMITFGDGISGSKPASGDRVVVDYLETLASAGNIGARLITDLVTPLYQDGQLVTVHVTNPRPATGGAEAETVDFARHQAPAELRTSWRAVTKEDYRTLVEGYPGVAKAQILDTNDCLNIRYYTVNIAVAPNGGGLPSALLKKNLADYLESRRVITTQVNLFDPAYREVAIDAELFAYTGEDLYAVRARAETALAEFFAFDRMDFGTPVRTSDLVALLDGVRGVSYVQLFLPAADVITRPGEIPVLGPLQLTVKRAQG
jgi:predicted phage baseplate assembly protein